MVSAAREGQSQEKLWWSSDTGVPIVCYTSFFFLRNTNVTISQLVPSHVSLRITDAQQLLQVKGMIGGIGDMLYLDLFSKLENGLRSKGYFR